MNSNQCSSIPSPSEKWPKPNELFQVLLVGLCPSYWGIPEQSEKQKAQIQLESHSEPSGRIKDTLSSRPP